MTIASKPLRWFDLQPWHTNAALALIGLAMIAFSRQLISEYNDGYRFGISGVSGAQAVLFLAALLVYRVKPANVNRWTLPIILVVAFLCRMVTLFPDPFLSTDVYRYAWDGVVQHSGHNPFRYIANDPTLQFLREPNADLYANMNRRDYAHTIYPPVAQILFFLITWISPLVTGMKAAMIAFEALTVWGLLLILRFLRMPRERVLLYAWFPLLIWEIGSSGHLDSVAMAFITFAFLFRLRRQDTLVGLFLGLAFLTKFYPIVLFPALYRRGDWKMPASIAALTVFTYSLYASAGSMVLGFLGAYTHEEGITTGERYFLLEQFQHVPGLHWLANGAYTVFAGLVLFALAAWAWQIATPRSSSPAAFLPPALGIACALMLLFSPHYPWYVAWLVPFLVLIPSLPILTYTLGLFYLCTTALAVGYGPKQFLLNQYLYSAVLVVALLELALRRIPYTRGWFQPAMASLSLEAQSVFPPEAGQLNRIAATAR